MPNAFILVSIMSSFLFYINIARKLSKKLKFRDKLGFQRTADGENDT